MKTDLIQYTTFDSIQDHVSHVRQVFNAGKPRDIKWRKFQLQRLYDMVSENEERLCEAMAQDMRKPRHEAMSGDIAPVLDECLYFIDNLDELIKDQKVKARSNANSMDTVVLRKDPLGVVLILGSWNYPVQLLLVPFAGAIAAGNSVILKLSEVAPHTASVITEIFPKYMDTSCYRIINGSVEETTFLLKEKFDHIFYTGNENVAKVVMAAAAKNLTPVTLELGGKSPAVITPDADIQLTANRIAFGKFYNTGQICIAVDHVLCPKSKLNEFVTAFKKTLNDWYGDNPQHSDDLARIVNDRHVERLSALLNNRTSGEIAIGGDIDKANRYIAPTLVVNVKPDDATLMKEEIFGPILPVVTYNDIDEAIGMINSRAPPLALYVFSTNKKVVDKVLKNTQSGGVCINDCLMHQAEYSVPFGGVGASGMGGYHGAKSIATFTHERSILVKKQKMEKAMFFRYPPYNDRKYSLMRLFMIKHPLMLKLKAYRTPLKLLFALIAFFVVYMKRRSN